MKTLLDLLDELGGMPEKDRLPLELKYCVMEIHRKEQDLSPLLNEVRNSTIAEFRKWLGGIEISKENLSTIILECVHLGSCIYDKDCHEHKDMVDAISSAQIFKRTVKNEQGERRVLSIKQSLGDMETVLDKTAHSPIILSQLKNEQGG